MAHQHKAIIDWKRQGAEFLKGKYSREHTWTFDGGFSMPASSSPYVVPAPLSNPAFVDPEEAFVAAISSCHMLTFVYLAAKQGFEIESYHDEAVGEMAKRESGVTWVALVTLHPKIIYSSVKVPTPAEEEQLHHNAHHECYIANSVKTEIRVDSAGHD